MAVQFNRKSEPKFAVLVTGDIGSFSKGDILTNESDIAQYFRDMLDTNDVTWDKDDDALIAVAKSIPMPTINEGETTEQVAMEWEEEVCGALISQNSTNEVVTGARAVLPDTRDTMAIRGSVASIAPLCGMELDEQEAMRNALHEAAIAPEAVKLAGLRILLTRLTGEGITLDNKGVPSKWVCAFNKYPYSYEKPSDEYLKANDDKVRKEDQNLFAEYKIKLRTGEMFTYKWFEDLIENTKEGATERAIWKEIQQGIPSKKGDKIVSGPWANKSIPLLRSMARMHNDRFNGMVKFTKQASDAWKTMCAIATDPILSKNMEVGFVMDKPGATMTAITNGTEPIYLRDKNGLGAKSYSIAAFPNLDLDRALERGGTWTDVVESTSIGTQDTDPTAQEPLTKDTVIPVLYEVQAFLDRKESVTDLLALCNAKAGKGEESEAGFSIHANDLVDSIFKMEYALAQIVRVVGEKRWHNVLAARKDKQTAVIKDANAA